MKRRVADLLLIAAIVAGGFLVAKTGRERAGLRAEYGRLARAAGDLPVEDPTRVYVRALETGEPLHYAWRVYTPPNYRETWTESNLGVGWLTSVKAEEFLVRVRFREAPGGSLEVYRHFRGTSSAGTFGDPSLTAFVKAHSGELLAERAGANGVASFAADQKFVVLKLSLPEHLQAEARTTLPPDVASKYVPDLFKLELGTAPAQPGPVGPGDEAVSDVSSQVDESSTGGPAVDRPRRHRRWQVALRTSALLIAAIAVWFAYAIQLGEVRWLAARIAVMRPLARDLVVEDRGRIAVVKLEETWIDDNRWRVYLPEGRYRLCLALHGIDQDGIPAPQHVAPIAGGEHVFALEQTRDKEMRRVVARFDGREVLRADENLDWEASSGWSGGGQYAEGVQPAAGQPAILYRSRFHRPTGKGTSSAPAGPTDGVMLWIEPVGGSKAAP